MINYSFKTNQFFITINKIFKFFVTPNHLPRIGPQNKLTQIKKYKVNYKFTSRQNIQR